MIERRPKARAGGQVDGVELVPAATAATATTAAARDAGAELFESGEIFPQILDAIADMVLVKGEESKILWANRAFRAFYGMSNEELRDRVDGPFNQTDFTSQYVRDDSKVFATGELLDIPEEPVTRHDGVVQLFHTVKSPIRDAAGQIRMTVGVSRNITAQRRTQEELDRYRQHLEKLVGERTEQMRNLSDRLQIIVSSLAEGIVALDGAGNVRLLNPAAETLTGFATDDAKGRPLGGLLALEVEGQGDTLGEALRAHRPVTGRLRTPAGRVSLVSIKSSPLVGEANGLVGSVVMIRDIGLEREVEDQRLRQQKLESVGLLAGGIAHDFNNIVTGILGSISVARESARRGEDVGALLDEAERACLRTKGLTTQLLTFARGGAPLKKRLALEPIVRESAEFALRGSCVELSVRASPGLRAAEVDEGQLSQVVNNLVLNAKQSMADGGKLLITIEDLVLAAGSTLPLEPGRYLLLSFQDGGAGIPPENLPRLFDPYFTTRETGTGLGLASVHSIVRRHGGHVTASSIPGSGACFRIYLPACDSGKPLEPPGTGGPTDLRARHLLVVDDDPAVLAALRSMLQHLGHHVTTARGGAGAIEAFERARAAGHPFEAVFVDLTMPGDEGGLGIAAFLRAQDARLPLVVMSGYSVDPVMADPLARGFRAALPKPFTIEALKQTVASCFAGA